MVSTLLKDALVVAGQLFAILNPPSVIPTFIVLTEGITSEERGRVVSTASIAVVILMVIFACFGSLILKFMGISVASLRLGGGVILMILAVDMLEGPGRTRELEEEELAIVPIATPLLVGPGTISTIIILASTMNLASVILGALMAGVATYATLKYSDSLIRVLGRNGVRALGRFMSIIIAAVAAEMIYEAVDTWVRAWKSGG